MVTIFITDEAQDELIEEFKENELPELSTAERTLDILLELTDVCLTIRCQKESCNETYQKAERFFPPTVNLREKEQIQMEEGIIAEVHDHVQAFLAGELELQGIPADNDHSWLRHAILLRRLVIPYIKKHIADGSFEEQKKGTGLYLYCSEGEIVTMPVAGEKRPDLVYAKFKENGDIVEEPGRYYDDEMFSGERLETAITELESRPQHLNIEGIGDGLDWPPQFLEEYQCGRLLMDGRLRKNKLGSRVISGDFRRKDFLWQHPQKPSAEVIYVTVDTLLKLPEVEVLLKRIPAEMMPESIIEIVDAAFTCVIETDNNRKSTKLSLYNRCGIPMLSPVYAEAASICDPAKTFLGDGVIATAGEGYLGDVAISLLYGFKKILSVLIAIDWFGKYGGTEREQSGLLIEADEDEVILRRVLGTQRPELICSIPKGERVFHRPYKPDDEPEEIYITEKLGIEEIISLNRDPKVILKEALQENNDTSLKQEAAAGNPQAMKLLAETLLKRADTTEKKREVLAWYEKAAKLLPDDDDIEFEILMLKIEIENQ